MLRHREDRAWTDAEPVVCMIDHLTGAARAEVEVHPGPARGAPACIAYPVPCFLAVPLPRRQGLKGGAGVTGQKSPVNNTQEVISQSQPRADLLHLRAARKEGRGFQVKSGSPSCVCESGCVGWSPSTAAAVAKDSVLGVAAQPGEGVHELLFFLLHW